MRRGPRRSTAGLQLDDLSASLPSGLDRGSDQGFPDSSAAGRRVDHHLVQPRFDPERGRVHDHRGRADDLAPVLRHEKDDVGIGHQPAQPLFIRRLERGVELRQKARQRGVQLGGDGSDGFDLDWDTLTLP